KNLYRPVSNNPINATDPSGLQDGIKPLGGSQPKQFSEMTDDEFEQYVDELEKMLQFQRNAQLIGDSFLDIVRYDISSDEMDRERKLKKPLQIPGLLASPPLSDAALTKQAIDSLIAKRILGPNPMVIPALDEAERERRQLEELLAKATDEVVNG